MHKGDIEGRVVLDMASRQVPALAKMKPREVRAMTGATRP
jgi:hypothetical protein